MLKNSTQPAGGGNVMYPGKVPGKVKYTFAFGALGHDLWHDRNVLHDLFHRHH